MFYNLGWLSLILYYYFRKLILLGFIFLPIFKKGHPNHFFWVIKNFFSSHTQKSKIAHILFFGLHTIFFLVLQRIEFRIAKSNMQKVCIGQKKVCMQFSKLV